MELLRLMALFLRTKGYEVETFTDGRFVIERCRKALPAVVVVDVVMAEMGGLETIRRIRAIDPHLPVIVISGGGAHGDGEDYSQSATARGATASLPKPFDLAELGRAVEQEVNRGISI